MTGLIPFLGSQLHGQIYSVQGDYEFRPVFAARGGRLLYVEARVQGGSFVRPPVRPSGITTPYGGGP
ncbi:MAG: hypothetical protein R3B82_28080 [Sandaracinaceae bacterium]